MPFNCYARLHSLMCRNLSTALAGSMTWLCLTCCPRARYLSPRPASRRADRVVRPLDTWEELIARVVAGSIWPIPTWTPVLCVHYTRTLYVSIVRLTGPLGATTARCRDSLRCDDAASLTVGAFRCRTRRNAPHKGVYKAETPPVKQTYVATSNARSFISARARPLVFAAALSLLYACALRAQRFDATMVRVLDQRGVPVPHAVLDVGGGTAHIADDSGLIRMVFSSDTTTVRLRRMGFSPYHGPVGRAAGGVVTLTLTSTAQRLAAVTVDTKRELTPLEQTGFYDRVLRAQRGAYNAEFVPPEELDSRPMTRLNDPFLGRRFIRVMAAGRIGSVLVGRAGCTVAVLLDGQVMRGSLSSGPIVPHDYAAT